MRAFDWLLFAQVLATFAFRDALCPILLHVFLRFTESITRILAREHTVSELDGLQQSVVEFLSLLEAHFPATELTIVFHLMLHLVDHIRVWGPLSSVWMFPYERFLGFLCRTIKNRAHVAATATRFYLMYSFIQSKRSSIQTFMSQSCVGPDYARLLHRSRRLVSGPDAMNDRYGCGDVRVRGVCKERKLEALEYKHLCAGLEWVDPDFRRLCKEYKQAVARSETKAATMAEWIPVRVLTDKEKSVIGGPSSRVRVYPQATVRAVDFRSAASEAGMRSRTSYFSFTSLDEKDVLRTETGRILQIWEVFFNGVWTPFVQCEIYASIEPSSVGEPYLGLETHG